ncbi:glycine betaine ABC transporter substrate-binding protein [Pollutimonas sp. M17]|uniref:glycine betaine ABC transporter substrate-binding protein n=1 Tax=Pollutimonas sp. M17 TaxID=2962065 RepID=UPI0021F46086|nr:ABC transporter permease subunit [Pollutimonas sp. M17]
MSRWHRFLGTAALALACASGSGAAAAQTASCNQGRPVKLADLNWESATFTTHVVAKLLSAGYGCQTEVVPGTPAALESALVQDDVQVIAEIWSGRSPIIEKALRQGQIQIVGDTLAGGAEQGWYVPDYVVHGDPARGIEAMAPDLKGWQDLPRYKSLFTDPEDPGKGRFLNCPSGWVCEKTNSRLLQLHGLDDDYTNFRAGTGAALDAAISSAYDQGRPILFYYWQPAGLMAKYDFYKIRQDPFNKPCWDAIVSGEGKLCSSDFLTARLAIATSTPFARSNPDIMALFQKLQFEPPLLNGMILAMTETREGGEAMADRFLREHPEIWHAWLPAEAAARVDAALGVKSLSVASEGGDGMGATDGAGLQAGIFPDWSAAAFVNRQLMGVVKAYGGVFRQASGFMLTTVLLPVERAMQAVPPWLFLALVALLSWHATRKLVATVLYVACLYAIGAVGLWDKLIQTFSLVLVSTAISIVIGVPLGIAAARSRLLRRVSTPVLDVMQTLPSFVYLIPVLMLFGLGKVPALFATIIYAVPPLIRLTTLGLRQVDHNVMEAAQAFGVTRWQMLLRVTLPLARPSIMAGINQTTMMALSMVVVASMIGARGLGEDVLAGIQTLDVGRGLQAGVAIVILAIVIDRITQAYGKPRRLRGKPQTRKQP